MHPVRSRPQVSHLGGVSLVMASGEIDLASAPELGDTVLSRLLHGNVVMDVSGVTFMDSAGIQVLTKALRRANLLHRAFAVSGPPPAVARLLQHTGMDQVLAIYHDATAAVRALQDTTAATHRTIDLRR